MKNCGKRFHVYVATKEFMQEMIKIISPKYNPSVELQNTVLSLIQVSFLSVFMIILCLFLIMPSGDNGGETMQRDDCYLLGVIYYIICTLILTGSA